MPVLREGRVIGHSAVEPQPAEPTIREVQMHLLAQPPLRTDPHAIAADQHPDPQLRLDRRPTRVAIIRPNASTAIAQLHAQVDRSKSETSSVERRAGETCVLACRVRWSHKP